MLPGICNVIPLAAVCDRVRRSPALLMLSVEVASAFSFAFGSSSSPEVKIFGRYLLMDDVRRGVLEKGKPGRKNQLVSVMIIKHENMSILASVHLIVQVWVPAPRFLPCAGDLGWSDKPRRHQDCWCCRWNLRRVETAASRDWRG